MTLKAITANRLQDGEVVYLAPEGAWSERLQAAQLLDSPDQETAYLGVAQQSVLARLVVEPYSIPVDRSGTIVVALSQRERIRAQGPTVHPAFGKRSHGG